MQRWQPRQQFGQSALGTADELLEVVQHQQHALAAERSHQAGHAVAAGRAAAGQLQGAGDGGLHLRRVFAGHQRNKGDAFERQRRSAVFRRASGPQRAVLTQGLRDFNPEPRLAAAARPEQGDQAARKHQRPQTRCGHVGAEQTGEVGRQRCRRGTGHGRRFSGLLGRCLRWRSRHRQAAVQRGQALAFVGDPLVVEAGHQLAAVQRQSLGGAAGAGQALESQRVAAECATHHTQRHAVGQQHGRARRAGRFEQALQRGQRLPQPVAPHVQRHTGPQQFNQFFARMRALGRQRQPRQQGRGGA